MKLKTIKLIEQLNQVQNTGVIDEFGICTAIKLLQQNLKLGMGLNKIIFNKFKEQHHIYNNGEKKLL